MPLIIRRSIGPWTAAHGLILAASVFALASAHFVEHVLGVPPCKLCYTQRTAYWIAGGISLVALIAPRLMRVNGRMLARWSGLLLVLALVSTAIGGGYAAYHTGVEWKWWPGPSSCTGAPVLPDSLEALEKSKSANAMPCDWPAYKIFGLSLAALNAIYAFGVVLAGLMVMSLADGPRWREASRPRGAEALP